MLISITSQLSYVYSPLLYSSVTFADENEEDLVFKMSKTKLVITRTEHKILSFEQFEFLLFFY